MTRNSSCKSALTLLGAGLMTALLVTGPVWAQSSTPGADRTQSTNYNSNQPPANGATGSGGKTSYNGFNPTTGTWSASGSSGAPLTNPTNGFNAKTGTWAGSSSTATGGVWSTTSGTGGGSVNVFTPSQSVSGSSSSGPNLSFGQLGNGPQVIPHVTVRSRLPIFSRVPIRPEL